MLQSTHQYQAIWPHINLLYKCVHPNLNKQSLFTHNLSSSASRVRSFLFQKSFRACKCLKLHAASLSHSFKDVRNNRLIGTDHIACTCGVLRQISRCQLHTDPKMWAVFMSQCETGTSGPPRYFAIFVFVCFWFSHSFVNYTLNSSLLGKVSERSAVDEGTPWLYITVDHSDNVE